MLHSKHFMACLGLLILVVLAFGSAETQDGAEGDAFDIQDTKIESGDYGMRHITGILENKTDKDQNYIQVQFNLYDSDGVQVGSTADNTNNLEAGGKWRFRAIIMEDEAVDYKLKGVTGF